MTVRRLPRLRRRPLRWSGSPKHRARLAVQRAELDWVCMMFGSPEGFIEKAFGLTGEAAESALLGWLAWFVAHRRPGRHRLRRTLVVEDAA